MKRLIAIGLLAFALSGCASSLPSLNLSTQVTKNTMLGVESSYGVVLSGERFYKSLPLCQTGTVISATNPCARRSVIVSLQALDRKAIMAISSARTFIKNYPNVDATNVLAAAGAAVTDIKNVLDDNGVKTNG